MDRNVNSIASIAGRTSEATHLSVEAAEQINREIVSLRDSLNKFRIDSGTIG